MRGLASVTIDGIPRFDVEEAIVEVSTRPDLTGMPVMQSLTTAVHFTINANDKENMPFGSIQKLFDLSNVPEENKIKSCKVEFWKDDTKKDVICSYSFKGWISHFRTSNTGIENGNKGYNHLIHVSVVPVINKALHSELRIGN
jgi:hypothetical protein